MRYRQAQAEQLFAAASKAIESQKLSQAVDRFREYLGNPLGNHKAEATRLLAQVELVTSPAEVQRVLHQMSDRELERLEKAAELPADVDLSQPQLAAILKEQLRQCLPREVRQREQLKRLQQANEGSRLGREGQPSRFRVGDEVRNRGTEAQWSGRLVELGQGHCRVRVDFINPHRKDRFQPGLTYDFVEQELAKQSGSNPLKELGSAEPATACANRHAAFGFHKPVTWAIKSCPAAAPRPRPPWRPGNRCR